MQSRTPAESEFTGWHKARASEPQGNGCVEVGYAPGHVAVRDTKNRGGGMLTVSALKWNLFVDVVLNVGENQQI